MDEIIEMFKYSQSLIELWRSEIDVYHFCLMYQSQDKENIELFEHLLSNKKYAELIEENKNLY